jgi:metallophosphoesterase (TIGR00282 family)
LRPANYPSSCAGRGYGIYDCGFKRILVINALGQINTATVNSPFDTIDDILEKEKGNYHIAVLDLHAESTSEKAAIARYFDGRIQVIFGTHTHVQTNDARILPQGSGFITDLGMCGPVESILGVESSIIIERLRRHASARFEFAEGDITASGAIFTLENDKVTSVMPIQF